jgi:signal peptidase
MNPTLKNFDMLEVVPYNGNEVQVGDVITFISPNRDRSITHRVISVDSRGIRTLGDNNSTVDDDFRQAEDIIGQVVCAQRKKRHLQIYGGKTGHLYAIGIRSIRLVRVSFWRMLLIFRPIYHYMCRRSAPLKKYVPPKLQPRVLSFTRGDMVDQQLVMGKRVIGRRSPDGSRWQIKPPFRLFVDEKTFDKQPTGSPN